MSSSRERLKQLEEIEQDVVTVIESASQSLLELSKEQPSEDYVISSTTRFLKGRLVKTGVYVGMSVILVVPACVVPIRLQGPAGLADVGININIRPASEIEIVK